MRRAVEDAAEEAGLELNGLVTVADVSKVKMYMRNFGEFYDNQIQYAGTIILSRTQKVSEEKQMKAVELIREKNPDGVIITTPWDELTGRQILDAIERSGSLAEKLMAEEEYARYAAITMIMITITTTRNAAVMTTIMSIITIMSMIMRNAAATSTTIITSTVTTMIMRNAAATTMSIITSTSMTMRNAAAMTTIIITTTAITTIITRTKCLLPGGRRQHAI